MPGHAPLDALFATRWVHAFEEDTARGAVYRPADADLPLSRRPRGYLELAADGSARVFVPGPDDRPRAHPAEWAVDGDEVVVRPTGAGGAGGAYHVVEWSAERLVVRRPAAAGG